MGKALGLSYLEEFLLRAWRNKDWYQVPQVVLREGKLIGYRVLTGYLTADLVINALS